MNKPQWITAGIAILMVIGLYTATQKHLFGVREDKNTPVAPVADGPALSTDSILYHAKEKLSPGQAARIGFLEKSISRGDVRDQQLHVFHQLAVFWRDSARVFAPYGWYTAEAARLENSEKSLTFAAHLFLNNLRMESDPQLKQWEAFQAKDLFNRSLKLNANNDSSKVGLGAVYLFGGIASPMEGIGLIRQVADKDSSNTYAQLIMAEASLMSGQTDKAIERFKIVARQQPKNLEMTLLVADLYERSGKTAEAVEWYTRSLPLIPDPALKKEVEARIAKLGK
jgi:tetratricopeptide (TPR) repeat protein